MSPKRRDREYARRRYQQWEAKQMVKGAKRHRQRQIALVAGGAAAVVLVIAGVLLVFSDQLFGGSKNDTTTTAAAATTAGTAATKSSTAASAAVVAGCTPAPQLPTAAASFAAAPDAALSAGKTWTMTIKTNCGTIVAQLDGAKAPKTVASTIFLSGKKFWDNSPCHRLTTAASSMFVLQCGDPTGTGTGSPGYHYGPVENAPADGIYPAGTLAMARTDPNGNGSQFFVVYKDTTLKDPVGYTVFGKVTQGLDIVQKIAAADTDPAKSNGPGDGAPAQAVSLLSTEVTPG